MSHFDNAARTWDENPIHLERSLAIAAKWWSNCHSEEI